MQPTPVFLPEESHRQRSLVGYSPWSCKELDTTEHTRTLVCLRHWRSQEDRNRGQEVKLNKGRH